MVILVAAATVVLSVGYTDPRKGLRGVFSVVLTAQYCAPTSRGRSNQKRRAVSGTDCSSTGYPRRPIISYRDCNRGFNLPRPIAGAPVILSAPSRSRNFFLHVYSSNFRNVCTRETNNKFVISRF